MAFSCYSLLFIKVKRKCQVFLTKSQKKFNNKDQDFFISFFKRKIPGQTIMKDDKFQEKIDERFRLFRYFKEQTGHRYLIDGLELLVEAVGLKNKILVFGNGGSATQASHFAAELVNRFYRSRPALPALALNTDIANITSISNDSGYRWVFSRQVEALGKAGDIALGLTTGGKSPNILEALTCAKQMNLKTIAMCGMYTEPIEALHIDSVISVPSTDTPAIQELHLFILHWWAEMIERKFFKGD